MKLAPLTDVLAIYGAILSTVLAAGRGIDWLLAQRTRITVNLIHPPHDRGTFRVLMINKSHFRVEIEAVRIEQKNGPSEVIDDAPKLPMSIDPRHSEFQQIHYGAQTEQWDYSSKFRGIAITAMGKVVKSKWKRPDWQ